MRPNTHMNSNVLREYTLVGYVIFCLFISTFVIIDQQK